MRRRPPRSNSTDTLLTYTTRFRSEAPAQGRVDAVGADEQGARNLAARRFALLVDKGSDDVAALLAPVRQVPAGVDSVGADALAHRLQQQHLQLAAVDRELWPAVAGGLAARFRPDELAALGVVGELGRAHAEAVELPQQAELVELAHRMRQQVDADAERLQRRRGLEDLDRPARLVQRERDRQSKRLNSSH